MVVTTVRALSATAAPHPGPRKPMPPEYKGENVAWVEKGCANLVHHIQTVKKAGIKPVVCINAFFTDTPNEVNAIRRICRRPAAGRPTKHWELGGEGALEWPTRSRTPARKRTTTSSSTTRPAPAPAHQKIATEVYGADGVEYSAEASKKAQRIEKDPELSKLGTCMVKTHLSLSDNPNIKGVPTGWKLYIRDVLTYGGAGFIVPVAGAISLMPGTASNPAYRRVDVDGATGKVKGLF